jgi:transposase
MKSDRKLVRPLFTSGIFRTSISLEPVMWEAPREIAACQGKSVHDSQNLPLTRIAAPDFQRSRLVAQRPRIVSSKLVKPGKSVGDVVKRGHEDFWPIVSIEGAKMGQKSGPVKEPVEQVVKEIRRATRRQFSAEEKIRIVLSGLRGEDSIAELCRREGIVQNLYYRWSKEFLEAGKKRLAGDTARAATSDEVNDLRREAGALKEVVAELMLENRLLKKSTLGAGEYGA